MHYIKRLKFKTSIKSPDVCLFVTCRTQKIQIGILLHLRGFILLIVSFIFSHEGGRGEPFQSVEE